MVKRAWVQEPLFPLWQVGDLVMLRSGKECCRGRVTRLGDDGEVRVEWPNDRMHPPGFLPAWTPEWRLVPASPVAER